VVNWLIVPCTDFRRDELLPEYQFNDQKALPNRFIKQSESLITIFFNITYHQNMILSSSIVLLIFDQIKP
jgi:hypothetical protein